MSRKLTVGLLAIVVVLLVVTVVLLATVLRDRPAVQGLNDLNNAANPIETSRAELSGMLTGTSNALLKTFSAQITQGTP